MTRTNLVLLNSAAVLTAFTCILLSACTAQGPKGVAAAAAPTPVMILEVQPRNVPIVTEFAAQTYARNMVEVRSRVEGYIESWRFQPGAEVKAGQVLYVLDRRPFQATLQQARGNLTQSKADLEFATHQVTVLQARASLISAQANLVRARHDYERLAPLVKADAASKQDFDAANAALQAGEANVTALRANVEQTLLSTRTQIEAMRGKVEALEGALRTAELHLDYATIQSPISGRIGDTLIPVGGLVTPNSSQPLTTIIPLDPIWVRFKVTEAEYLSWVKRHAEPGEGLPLTLILADKSEYPFRGRIENALNQVDPTTGTLEIQAKFPNPRHTMLPGQFGRVQVHVEERKNVIVIPQKAVQQLQSMQTVFTVEPNDTVTMRAITTSSRTGNSWIVEQGLKPGDRLIVEGLLKVRPGSRVHPLPYQSGAASAKAGS